MRIDLNKVPMPNGRPVPVFFGRRLLTYRDLIDIGFVNNAMTLRRLIAEGRFPPPLDLGRKIRLWDAVELQDLVDGLKARRLSSKNAEPQPVPAECRNGASSLYLDGR